MQVLFFIPVKATITKLRLTKEHHISSLGGPEGRINRVLKLHYEFVLNGKTYRGVDIGGHWEFSEVTFSGKPRGRPLYKGKMGIGDEITVYYQQGNPGVNTHRRHEFFGGLVTICLAQIFLLIAINIIRKWL